MLYQLYPAVVASQHQVNYAISASAFLHLHHMCELHASSSRMHHQVLNAFHSMRKTDRYWAELTSDLVIEHDMMRQLKGKRGPAR
jgi:hypothetical protein